MQTSSFPLIASAIIKIATMSSERERNADIGANASPETVGAIGRLSREDYKRSGRCTNYTPPASIKAKKKRKAKAKQQKQSRKKNRR